MAYGHCFAILDLRVAEIGGAQITSHLEEIALEAIEAEAAFICDIIGSALADESAAIAAKWLRPEATVCTQAKEIYNTAFLICIRLAFVQARIWELTNDAPIYETPPDHSEVDLTIGSNFQRATDELTASKHQLEAATQGKESGHRCTRCKQLRRKPNSTTG